jgi:hypothetical protein
MLRRSRPSADPLAAATGARIAAPSSARNLVFVVLDSLRYDSWLEAAPQVLASLGEVQRRWSYASWTAPSHYNLLMGLLPHSSPPEVYASEYYKEDFRRYSERLGVSSMEFARILPSMFLPTYLKYGLGYETHAMVSMPVLNPHTVLNRDFDSYELMPRHNDMAAMIERMHFSQEHPSFYLLNIGETHYPYALPDEDPESWPRISGVHGVFKHLGGAEGSEAARATAPEDFFDNESLRRLHGRQINAVEYLDQVFRELFNRLPANTWVIVTSDHGELFGEERFFGHGPINHEKVFEVPFVEGMVP